MACKYTYNGVEYSKEQLVSKLSNENSNFQTLYNNLVNEITNTETGRKVLDRIKRDYNKKQVDLSKVPLNANSTEEEYNSVTAQEILKAESGKYKLFEKIGDDFLYSKTISQSGRVEYRKIVAEKYTLEEQQEEAIVELLGLMTAEKLDNVKDGKLISLLKRLLKEIKSFVRGLLNQKEVEIDKLPDNMTLGDLSDLLAYSNSKLILPGYEVEYTTPDNNKFKTYIEASNHISELAKSAKDVDLSDVSLNDVDLSKIDYFENSHEDVFDGSVNKGKFKKENNKWFVEWNNDGIQREIEEKYVLHNYRESSGNGLIRNFIEKNKEYEQSKEIVEEYKKVNNIQYNPEEVYSRGQEFSSVVGAYSSFDVNLMMQNLLSHIEDNEKAGGKFAISAFTKPIDKTIGHLEGGGGKIKFKLYPQSNDILWAANTDVYSGSVWDASEKVNKDKKSELLGVSYTKYPSLNNVNTVQPNLAAIVDDLNHHHNELGIVLTGNNFRLEYDEDIPYQTKKIIDGINKILDQKYSKLVKPEIKTKKLTFEESKELKNLQELNEQSTHLPEHLDKEDLFTKKDQQRLNELMSLKGIQPTQTKETLKESIDSVKKKTLSPIHEQYGENPNKEAIEADYKDGIITKEQRDSILNGKEYTSQALINTKVAILKEIAKKYPRSLIRSEVKSITNYENYVRISGTDGLFDPDEMPFQKISSLLPSNGRVIDNPVKPTKLTKTSFKYISNPEINPYKFTPDKGGYSDVVSRLKSRLITLKITDKNMVIKDPNMFSRLQESWTNQAEKLYNLISIPKVMIEDNGKVKFRDYLFNEIDYKNGVITESNKSSGDRIKLEEAGLSQQNINHFFNNYFNESHTYSDGSSSEPVNKEFSVFSYIEFINKRQRTNLDANSFNTIGEYINELNRLALEPNDISIGLLSSEEVDKRACKR